MRSRNNPSSRSCNCGRTPWCERILAEKTGCVWRGEATKECWQTRRDGSLRGIVEIEEEKDDSKR